MDTASLAERGSMDAFLSGRGEKLGFRAAAPRRSGRSIIKKLAGSVEEGLSRDLLGAEEFEETASSRNRDNQEEIAGAGRRLARLRRKHWGVSDQQTEGRPSY